MAADMETPAARAVRLLRDVLGEGQYRQLRTLGFLDLPSQQVRGRTYRLDRLGNLSYREAGESGFHTSLCVQPQETLPRDDQVALRYLLVTADEERLLATANPITFGLYSLVRALHHDFARGHPAWVAGLLTSGLLLLFIGALAVEGWALVALADHQPLLAAGVLLGFLAPALIGLALLAAGAADVIRVVLTWRARRRLAV